jgi:hypothetical protein
MYVSFSTESAMAKGKNINPADAFRKSISRNPYIIHDTSLNEYRCQERLSGRKNSRRYSSLGQLTEASLSAVEQGREAKITRFFPGQKGHMGYVWTQTHSTSS